MTKPKQSLSPRSGFKAVPAWAWTARLAVFPGDNIDSGKEALLDLSDADIEAACARFAACGVTLIQAAGFHARLMWIPHLERLTDLNRRITEAAHRHGMKVFDHQTCNGMWTHVADRLNGWCPDDATCVDIRFGRRYVPDQAKFACLNHADFRRHYFDYITDYVARTKVDGMMCDDMLFFYGQYGCGCDHCRARFRQTVGYDMPQPGNWPLDDYTSPVWRDWMRFRMDSVTDFKRELHQRMPQDFLLFTDSSSTVLDLDDCHHAGQTLEGLARAGDQCLLCENGGIAFRELRPNAYSNYQNWEQMYVNRKYMQAVARHFQIPCIQHQYPATPAEGWFCWALNKFTGMLNWRDDAWHYGGPRYADEFEQWTPDVDQLNWEAKHECLWRHNQGAAEVGLLYSLGTKLNLGADPQPHGEAFSGWAQTLQREGIFFDALIDADLEQPGRLKRFKLLILPNAVCLSDGQLAAVRQFVRDGGCVIATHRTSLADENGANRSDFGLADLLGVHLGNKPTTQRSAWLLDYRHKDASFAQNLPPRLAFQPALSVTWDGETADRWAWAWAELVRVSFGWPTMPATVESRYGAGRVLYHLPTVGQLAYREGAYPIWHRAPQKEEIILRQEETGVRFEIRQERTPQRMQYRWVDEGSEDYRRLIVNSVRHLLPQASVALSGRPAGVLCELHRLGENPGDESADGDLVVSLLNVAGMQFKPGDNIPSGAEPVYPPLRGLATLSLADTTWRSALLFSPDHAEPLPLTVKAEGGRMRIEIPLEEIKRVAFIRIMKHSH
jgi:hypothetical protein